MILQTCLKTVLHCYFTLKRRKRYNLRRFIFPSSLIKISQKSPYKTGGENALIHFISDIILKKKSTIQNSFNLLSYFSKERPYPGDGFFTKQTHNMRLTFIRLSTFLLMSHSISFFYVL